MLGLLSTTVGLLGACGSDAGDAGGYHGASYQDATAVSANVDRETLPKNAVSKVDPVVRRGVEAPLTSTPESGTDTSAGLKPGPGAIDDGSAMPAVATKKFASGFESGVALTEPTGLRDGDRYLVGADTSGFAFPVDLWGAPIHWRSWVLSTVGEMTDAPVTDFLTASLKPVAGRNGGWTSALSLHSKVQSGGGGSQSLFVQNAGMEMEPVVYQRMWVKFDESMLERAQAVGSAAFYQVFWEAVARPDYRIRLTVRYDDTVGLYWQAIADLRDDGPPAWVADLTTARVVIAPPSVADGWHKVEVWMDRANGRFKAAIDGKSLVDRTGGLIGESGNRIDTLRMMMVHSLVAPLAEVLFDDLEVWDSPPADAWAP